MPAEIKSYPALQSFVKARAVAAGIDVSKPFPFLVLSVLAGGVMLASFFFPSRAELTAHKEKLASQPA